MMQKESPVGHKKLKLIALFLFIFALASGGTGLWFFTYSAVHLENLLGLSFQDISQGVKHSELLKSEAGRTNIVVLGNGGQNHEGSSLTDTMMLVSIPHNTGNISLISLPRDLWSETLQDKINSAYYYGNLKTGSGGIQLVKDIVHEATGLTVHYAMRLDFDGFTEFIDAVGGVDVFVSSGFTDNFYPIAGKETDTCGGDTTFACRYEQVTFAQGTQHMSGIRALQYVRSRHANGNEGTDFSRGRRQQDVILSLISRLKNPKIYVEPYVFDELFRIQKERLWTDLSQKELAALGNILFTNRATMKLHSVSIQNELVSPPLWQYNGKYVLVPKVSWEALHKVIEASLSGEVQDKQ